jgi:hypothetical protein
MNKPLTVLVILLLLCIKSFSQIDGDIRNNNNKRIANAVIIVMDTTKNIIDSVISDETGFYLFKNLKPGIYLIEAKASGFENRIYKNVMAREKLDESKVGRDRSSTTRLQIVLFPIKKSN